MEKREKNRANLPILGAIAGDIIGSVYEWDRIKHEAFPLFCDESNFTDDTVMTIAVADTLIRKENFTETLHRWGNKYPHSGYGGMFHQWLQKGRSEAIQQLWQRLCHEGKSSGMHV